VDEPTQYADEHLISDFVRYTNEDLAATPPGILAQSTQRLFEATDEDDGWGLGPEIGIVVFHEERTPERDDQPGVAVFTASFIADEGRSRMQAHGRVPGNGTWVGEEVIGLSGRTGRFRSWPEESRVVGRNPRRWG